MEGAMKVASVVKLTVESFIQLEIHAFPQVWLANPHSQQYNDICFLANRQRQLPMNHNKKYTKLILKTCRMFLGYSCWSGMKLKSYRRKNMLAY